MYRDINRREKKNTTTTTVVTWAIEIELFSKIHENVLILNRGSHIKYK